MSSSPLLNSDLLLPPSPSPAALLHRYASSVSPVQLRRFLSASSASAICIPRTSSPSLTKKTIKCQATTSQESQLYKGVYGPWTVEPSDVREVLLSFFFFPPPFDCISSMLLFYFLIWGYCSWKLYSVELTLSIPLPISLICYIENCLCMK